MTRRDGGAGPDDLPARYQRRQGRAATLMLGGGGGVLILCGVFASMGATGTGPWDIFAALFAAARGMELTTPQRVILYLRLPRVAMAVVAGCGLSISGAAMQGITRNPLVSPFTMGVSNAAAFGASLSIVFGLGLFPGSQGGVVLTAFFLALLCAGARYGVSIRAGMGAEAMVLTGIAVNYLFSAATSVIQYFADEHRLAAAVAWAFGSLNGAEWGQVRTAVGAVAACSAGLLLLAPALDVLSSGSDETARSLGVDPSQTRLLAGVLSVMATAAVICFTGVIGFVGLAGPHIARMLLGSGHRRLLPMSAVVGAALTLTADTVGRLILAPVMIPVGIVVSFLGVPILLHLLLVRRKGGR